MTEQTKEQSMPTNRITRGNRVSHPWRLGDRLVSQEQPHPDWCVAYGSCGDYVFLGASAAGKRHRYDEKPRDDAFAVVGTEQWIVAAVSDGVGARPQSRFGASFSVNTLCEIAIEQIQPSSPRGSAGDGLMSEKLDRGRLTLCYSETEMSARTEDGVLLLSTDLLSEAMQQADQLQPEIGTITIHHIRSASNASPSEEEKSSPPSIDPVECLRYAFQETRLRLDLYARQLSCEPRDLGCTLLAMILNVESGQMAVGHVGDGLICALPETGEAFPLSHPSDTGEVGVVFTFTQPDWEKYLDVRSAGLGPASDLRSAYLMSDGVADDVQYGPPPDILSNWAREMDREIRESDHLPHRALRLLQWVDGYKAPGSMDDRTLLVILRKGE